MLNKDSVVGVIGTGTMGIGIAQVAATSGHKVKIYDSNSAVIQKAIEGLRSLVGRLVEKNKITKEKSDSILNNISIISDLKNFSDCSLVIEAVIENLEVKQELFSDLEKIVSADCVLATNTSSLSITSIASSCENPSRVVGIHFFNPAPLMPLVEIVGGLASDSAVVTESRKLIDGWGKITVFAKDTPGFIVNRVARPFYGEAIRIYEEGIADFATIDWSMREHGFKMGPFELMDLIGNDINYTVTETVWKQMFYDARYKPSLTQKRLFEAKRFGKKSGQGYYDYADGAVVSEPKKDSGLSEKIFTRIISMLINEAAEALYMNVASRDDLDLAMIKGVNYPKGLLKWCDEIGAKKILNELEALREKYSEERYRHSALLKQMVNEKRKFY